MSKIAQLEKHASEKKQAATLSFEEKVCKLESLVKSRIKKQTPMGDLPFNANQFIVWEDEKLGVNPTNRSSYYQDHNKHLKARLEQLYPIIKKPPVLKSEADDYKNEIAFLNKAVSGLADENIALRQKVKLMSEENQALKCEIERLNKLLGKKSKVISL